MRPLAAALDANLLVLWRGRPVEESFLTLYIRCGATLPLCAFVFAPASRAPRPRLPSPRTPCRAAPDAWRACSLVSALLETPAALKSKGVKAALCDIVTAVAVKCAAQRFAPAASHAHAPFPRAGTGSW